MADQTEKLLREALKLPTPDRARLAAELIASVDGGAEPEAEAAWAAEIDRRVRKVQSAGPEGNSSQEVHARIATLLRAK